ncbi:MAG: prepilin-type N-terminal cleavage/methylation domain-containing protein [bacterium]|jgi:hypothetical protein
MKNERGSSLVGMLVALAVIAVMVSVFYIYKPFSQTPAINVKGSTKQTQVGQAMDKGREGSCVNNLSQIKAGLEVIKVDGDLPPDLDGLKRALKFPDSMFVCPVNGQPYSYNPQIGEVHCPNGHG